MTNRIFAIMVLLIVFLVLGALLYGLYLHNVSIVDIYLRKDLGQKAPSTIIITIPPGAGSDPRIGFNPRTINVVLGVNNTVIWINRDSTWHTAHSNIPEFYSNYIPPGGNFSHTFLFSGVYPYHCDPHPWMTGKITVYPTTSSSEPTQITGLTFGKLIFCALCVPSNNWSGPDSISKTIQMMAAAGASRFIF